MSAAGWRPNRPLKLREQHSFTQRAAELLPNVKRRDDLLNALTWGIATDPHQFTNLFGNWFLATTRPYPDAPQLAVIFTVEYAEGCATLWWIEQF